MFPATWDPSCAAKRRKRTFLEETDESAQQSIVTHVNFQSDLQQTIMRKLNTTDPFEGERSGHGVEPGQLNLDHILSRVPYKTMLENLFSNVTSQGGEGDDVHDVPILGRAYEESFMRQAHPGEQSCVMAEQCECMFIDKNAPFVGVELRLQGDPDTPQMCVLCSRATTQKCFYDICFLGKNVKGVIQRYGGIFGQPGEYAQEVMIIPPRAMGLASMPVPSVSHQRNRYSVVVHGGVKHLKQHRVGVEDFHRPSSKEVV
jgi:hypothetical protein